MPASDTTSMRIPSRATGLVFLAGLIAGLLISELLRPDVSVAQIPDAGAQRHAVATESRRTNQLLGEMLDVLKTGTLKVQVVEKTKSTPSRAAPPPPARPRR